jgi:hypothetical protein
MVNLSSFRKLKEIILFARGNATEMSVERRSRSIPILEDLMKGYQKIFARFSEGEDGEENVHYASHEKWVVDLQPFVNVLLQEELLQNKGERHHAGFPQFRYKLYYVDDNSIYKRQIQEEIAFNNDAMEMREESIQNKLRQKDVIV